MFAIGIGDGIDFGRIFQADGKDFAVQPLAVFPAQIELIAFLLGIGRN